MKTRITLGIVVLLLFMGCKSAANQEAQAAQTAALLAGNEFEITFNWASPMGSNELNQLGAANMLGIGSATNRINLIGSTNYMRFKGDSLSVYLPYYGTRQMGGQLGATNNAIIFDGVPTEYEVEPQQDKQRTKFRFELQEDTEFYNVFVTVFHSGRALVRINPSQRTFISYEGTLKALEEEAL